MIGEIIAALFGIDFFILLFTTPFLSSPCHPSSASLIRYNQFIVSHNLTQLSPQCKKKYKED